MSQPVPPPSDPANFPEVDSSFAAGLAKQRLESSDPAIELEGEQQFADEMLRKLSGTDQAGRARRYVMGGEIGRGGMGAVYKVLDTDLRRTLAMKVAIQRDGSRGSRKEFIARFLEEAQVTGQLDHPGILPLHEVGMDAKGRIYFTMRMVRGKHLGEIFAQARKSEDGWTLEKGVVTLIRVCEAMAYAHSKGVVHRDLKPANVMAGRFGEVYVMDWGLCKVRGRSEREAERMSPFVANSETLVRTDRVEEGDELKTQAGGAVGTPAYMSPEQGRGEWERVDARSDVYSVGAMLYELLTGRPPYMPAGSRIAPNTVLQWLLERPPASPRELDPKVSPELCAICEHAMAREPERRYHDMLELADDLRAYLTGRPVRALKLNALQRTLRWTRRNPLVTGFLFAAVLGGGAAVASLTRLPRELVRAAAVDDAQAKADLLQQVNGLYTQNVVNRVDRQHVTVTHDYAETPGAIPIPATFLTELGAKISAEQDGVQVRHYSDYPFRFRGPAHLDDFGREALASLRADPSRPFLRFEEVAGRTSLRYAVPRKMGATCVACHNTHPESTKTDWKEGDVRGVLEIIRPLDRDELRMRSGLAGSFLLSAGIFVGLMGLAVMLLLRSGRHGRGAHV